MNYRFIKCLMFNLFMFNVSVLFAQESLPDITKILPSPPSKTSPQYVNDYIQYQWGVSVRNEDEGRKAYQSFVWTLNDYLKSFSSTIGFTLSQEKTPSIYKLLEYGGKYADQIIAACQTAYNKERPFVLYNQTSLVTSQENNYKSVSTFPCDQALKGWLYALMLTEACPQKQNQILKQGCMFGPAMMIAGYSFESDVNAGHLMACVLLSRLYSYIDFKSLMKEAYNEAQQKAKSRDSQISSTRASDTAFMTTSELPNSAKFLPQSPSEFSSTQYCDLVSYNEGKRLRTLEVGQTAFNDITYSTDYFCKIYSSALGHEISASITPVIYNMLCRVFPLGNDACLAAKSYYGRLRPYVYLHEDTSYPQGQTAGHDTDSYPAGHASGGWLMGLVLSEVTQQQDNLLARAFQYGQSRMITGYHWQSDVDAGRLVGSAVYARLHNVNDFTSQMEKAIKEYQSIYGGGSSAVRAISAEEAESESAPVYNLQGQRVDRPAKGIYIQGNSKRVVR